MNKKDVILAMMDKGLVLATGCTEPGSIGYASAIASSHLGKNSVESITVRLSEKLMTNAKSVGVPGSDFKGISYIAALGFFYGDHEKKLQVFSGISKDNQKKAYDISKSGLIKVDKAIGDYVDDFHINIKAHCSNGDSAEVLIEKTHRNVVLVKKNDEIILDKRDNNKEQCSTKDTTYADLIEFKDLIDYVEDEENDLSIFQKAIDINMVVCQEGLDSKRGYTLNDNTGYFAKVVKNVTGAVSSRMEGVDLTVLANSGSGNQGLAITISVVTLARELKMSESEILKAVAVAHLTAIYIKQRLKRISYLCGAVNAGAGFSSAIVYMKGGTIQQIEDAASNTLSMIGMFCDGAKSSCAMKMAGSIQMAMMSADFSMNGNVPKEQGIIGKNLDETLRNISYVEKQTSEKTNTAIYNAVFRKDGIICD